MNRGSKDPLVQMARDLLSQLAEDPALVDHIAENEIARRVAAGVLVPAERLQLVPGLALVPAGRVEHLEHLLHEAQAAAGDHLPAELSQAINEALTPAPLASEPAAADEAPAAAADESPDTEDPEPEETPEPESDAGPESEPEPEAEPGEKKMQVERLPTEPRACAECGADDLDLAQTHLSMIKTRGTPLCRACMKEH